MKKQASKLLLTHHQLHQSQNILPFETASFIQSLVYKDCWITVQEVSSLTKLTIEVPDEQENKKLTDCVNKVIDYNYVNLGFEGPKLSSQAKKLAGLC